MNKIKHIAIIAFNSKKTDLIEWSYFNKNILSPHKISALGFAANILEGTLNKEIKRYESGKLGEYRQLCNLIEENKLDAIIVFGEAHEIFEKKELHSLIETAIQNNIIVAANKTTADFILHSSLIDNEYTITQTEKKPEVVDTITTLAKAS